MLLKFKQTHKRLEPCTATLAANVTVTQADNFFDSYAVMGKNSVTNVRIQFKIVPNEKNTQKVLSVEFSLNWLSNFILFRNVNLKSI